VKTPTGKQLAEITLDKVLKGEIGPEDVRITPQTLRMQGEIAAGVGRVQFAQNMRRAAELTAIPDNRILEIYNALRPNGRPTRIAGDANEMETSKRTITPLSSGKPRCLRAPQTASGRIGWMMMA
jgi:propanediol dehydratase small subunit